MKPAKLRPWFIKRRAISVKMRGGRPVLRLAFCVSPDAPKQAIELSMPSVEVARRTGLRIFSVIKSADNAKRYNEIITQVARVYGEEFLNDDTEPSSVTPASGAQQLEQGENDPSTADPSRVERE